MAKQPTPSRVHSWLREIAAILAWAYVFVKLFLFDIDTYLLKLIAPGSTWLLASGLRLLAIALILASSWVILGNKRFLLSFLYVVGYPLVILFWKVPLFIVRRWAEFLVLLPSLYDAILSFRATLVLYAAIAASTFAIALADSPIILYPAMLCLGICLFFILYRAFGRSHSSRVYSLMASSDSAASPENKKGRV